MFDAMFDSGSNYFLGYYGSRGRYPYLNRHERLHKKNPAPTGYWIWQCLQEEKGKEQACADPFIKYNVLFMPFYSHRWQWMGSEWDPKMMIRALRKCCSHTLSSQVDYIKGYPLASQGTDIKKPIVLQFVIPEQLGVSQKL